MIDQKTCPQAPRVRVWLWLLLALAGSFTLTRVDVAQAQTQDSRRNSWPFTFEGEDIGDYIDNRVTRLALNRASDRATLTYTDRRDHERTIALPIRALDPTDRDVIPFIPIVGSRKAAERCVAKHRYLREHGYVAVCFYRDRDGIIWPTAINPQTMPRLMGVYEQAKALARHEEKSTAQTFADVGLTYLGARLPAAGAKKPSVAPASAATPTARVAPTAVSAASSAATAAAACKSSPRALARAMEKAGFKRPPGASVHHIVARRASGAERARKTLQRVGMHLDDAANGVFLPATRRALTPAAPRCTPPCIPMTISTTSTTRSSA